MGFEAGYLPIALRERGVPTVSLFGSRFWRENSKMAAKFEKWGKYSKTWARKFKKGKKNFAITWKICFFRARARFIHFFPRPITGGGGRR